MSNMEGTPDGKLNRGPSGAALFRAAEFKDNKEAQLERLGAEYRTAQQELTVLEQSYEEGATKTATIPEQEKERKALSIAVGRELYKQIGELKEKTAALAEDITAAGGNPDNFKAN